MKNIITPGDAEAQFKDAIASAGFTPPDGIESDGKLHRFSTNGKPSDKAGWYVLYFDGIPAGSFGSWRENYKENWCAKKDGKLTSQERETNRERAKAARKEADRQRAEERRKAEVKAAKLWDEAKPAPADHAYLADRKVKPYGLKLSGNSLLVPVKNTDGKLMSLQRIDDAGVKLFMPGCGTQSGFYLIGEPGSRLFIAEGYATAATLHEATGQPVAVAFNCGNLKPVAEAVRTMYPDAAITIAADDDATTDGNPGKAHAEAAAIAVGGNIILPDFGASRPDGVTDFNDLAKVQGLDAVRVQAEASRPVTWPEPEPLTSTGTAEPYPLDKLPPLMRDAVKEVAAFTQAPLALVAGSAFSALSVAAQGLADVQRAEGLTGPCSLFMLTVAESGERKTTADGFFLEPIRNWESEQEEISQPVMKAYRGEMVVWEAKRDGLKQKVRQQAKAGKNDGAASDELAFNEEKEPEAPRVPKLLRVDATPEALGYGLAKEWPAAGLITSEGGSLFGSHGMGKDSVIRNLALLNTLWDGNPHPVSRRTSESYTVRGARLTVGVQVQESPLVEFTRKSPGLARGMGFFARFLIALPESTQGTRFYKEPPKAWPALTALRERLSALLEMPTTLADDKTLQPPALLLTADAREIWRLFHDDVERELKASGELSDVRDVASKAADNAARIACLFHLLKHGPSGNIEAGEIGPAATIAAWHLVESRRFFAALAIPAELEKAARLDRWLIARCRDKHCDALSTREIQQYGPLRDKAARDSALDILEQHGRVRIESEGRQKWVRVNPSLLES